ncbi:TPA: hypothetical protein U1X88_001727 [Streptococcus suis]|nr:hypothetical protein [Streptococcus suis]
MLNVVFFSISFVNFINHQENFVKKSIWAIVFFFIGYFIWACLLCQIGKNQKIIFYLMSKKQQDYSAYKDNELEIIRELK